jgi:hypothetical protein
MMAEDRSEQKEIIVSDAIVLTLPDKIEKFGLGFEGQNFDSPLFSVQDWHPAWRGVH